METEIEAREFARILGAFLDTLSLENRVIFLRRYWFADGYRETPRSSASRRRPSPSG